MPPDSSPSPLSARDGVRPRLLVQSVEAPPSHWPGPAPQGPETNRPASHVPAGGARPQTPVRQYRQAALLGCLLAVIGAPSLGQASCSAQRGGGTPRASLPPTAMTGYQEFLYLCSRPTGANPPYSQAANWAYSIQDAQRAAQASGQGYVLFFCGKEALQVAGEGPQQLEVFKRTHGGASPPPTVFDQPKLLDCLHSAGLAQWVKLDVGAPNGDWRGGTRYQVQENSVIICAPDGEALGTFAGADCTEASLMAFLSQAYRPRLAAWRQAREFRQAQGAGRPARTSVAPLGGQSLANLLRFSTGIYSGASPRTEEAWGVLKELGIQTLISVEPRPAPASRALGSGMRCVHIPLGYEGVPQETALSLAKAVRDHPGPVYIHDERGVNPAPAAAAIASVILGRLSPEDALASLAQAGTSNRYQGLQAAVAGQKHLPDGTLNAFQVEFKERVEIPPPIRIMLEIEASWGGLEALAEGGWKQAQGHPGIDAPLEALRILGRITEFAALDEVGRRPEPFQGALWQAERSAAELSRILRSWKETGYPDDQRTAIQARFAQLAGACSACHSRFRGSR